VTSHKRPTRFLPTLTEIVMPDAIPMTDPAGHDVAVVADPQLVQRISELVQSRLRETIAALIQEQVSLLEPKIQSEMNALVRAEVDLAIQQSKSTSP
jgi:hypothetical protein